MEATSFYNTKTHYVCSSPPFNKNNLPKIVVNKFLVPSCLKLGKQSNHICTTVTGCLATSSLGSVAELEKELEAEMNPEEQEWLQLGGLSCKEEKGVVELLECLEREAIMGEDEGKDPTDYNRRAHIFDKSSRVFQALKELNEHPRQSSL